MDKKIKVLVISDHPLSPSGVGTQTKYMIEGLLQTGKFKFVCIGGAVKHDNYSPVLTKEWGEDWIIHPVDGYGNQEMIRSILRVERPDILWFMTDPRFWQWLWEIEDEIRPLVPMVYYHVWDNYPYPTYNKPWYESNDMVCTISKVTEDIVKTVAPSVATVRVPHTVPTHIFKKLEDSDLEMFKKEHLNKFGDKFVFFWNNRNARRKQSGSLIFWFKQFLDEVGHDKASLLMHTDIFDGQGQNLQVIIEELGLDKGQVVFSQQKVPIEILSLLYNSVDCTINIADAEGFGLSNLESLACETPVIVNMTGGLQEQVTDGKNWFGIGIQPASKAVIGSQDIPFIYEDRLSGDDVVAAMKKMYNLSKEEREAMGKAGREHVMKNYGFTKYIALWDYILSDIYDKCGSWETRKNYKSWKLMEVK